MSDWGGAMGTRGYCTVPHLHVCDCQDSAATPILCLMWIGSYWVYRNKMNIKTPPNRPYVSCWKIFWRQPLSLSKIYRSESSGTAECTAYALNESTVRETRGVSQDWRLVYRPSKAAVARSIFALKQGLMPEGGVKLRHRLCSGCLSYCGISFCSLLVLYGPLTVNLCGMGTPAVLFSGDRYQTSQH